MTTVIEVNNLTKRFGKLTALNDVSFTVEHNTIHGLLGRNGAGKTTLMQLLTGQQFATSGSIRVFGERPVENARVLGNVCFIKESQKYPDDFTANHVFRSAPWFFPAWDAEYAQRLIADFRLPLSRRIKKLSRGQLSSIGVIVGLASRAPLTFFDEPYLGSMPWHDRPFTTDCSRITRTTPARWCCPPTSSTRSVTSSRTSW